MYSVSKLSRTENRLKKTFQSSFGIRRMYSRAFSPITDYQPLQTQTSASFYSRKQSGYLRHRNSSQLSSNGSDNGRKECSKAVENYVILYTEYFKTPTEIRVPVLNLHRGSGMYPRSSVELSTSKASLQNSSKPSVGDRSKVAQLPA